MLHAGRMRQRKTEAWAKWRGLVAAGLMFGLLTIGRHEVAWAVACLLLGSGFLYAYYPAFWAIPTMLLSEAAAAATFGLINEDRTTRRIIRELRHRLSE